MAEYSTKQQISRCCSWCHMPLIPSPGRWRYRPPWSTYQVPGQPELCRETLCQTTTTTTIITDKCAHECSSDTQQGTALSWEVHYAVCTEQEKVCVVLGSGTFDRSLGDMQSNLKYLHYSLTKL